MNYKKEYGGKAPAIIPTLTFSQTSSQANFPP